MGRYRSPLCKVAKNGDIFRLKKEGGMGKLMVGVVRFLSLCAVLLLLPSLMMRHDIAFAQSTVAIDPMQGPPGQRVTGTGRNWPPGDHMEIYWDQVCPTCVLLTQVTVGGNGAFSADFNVPSDATEGAHTIYFWDVEGRTFLVATFTVTPAPPPATFSFDIVATRGWQSPTPIAVSQGQQLTISATGKWNVDFRNFNDVGPAGYPPWEDARIFQGCKLDQDLRYGQLLWRLDEGGPFFIDTYVPSVTGSGTLSFRIHDADACLVDNSGSLHVTVSITAGVPKKILDALPPYFCTISSENCLPLPVDQPSDEVELPEWLIGTKAADCLAHLVNFPGFSARIIEAAPELKTIEGGLTNPFFWGRYVWVGLTQLGHVDKQTCSACQSWLTEIPFIGGGLCK